MTNVSQTDVEDSDKDGAAQGMAPAERIRDLNDDASHDRHSAAKRI